jgi:MFS family permease
VSADERPSTLAALRERNLALIVSAVSVSALGSGMSQVALAFAVLRISNASGLGLVFFARELPIVVFLLLGGIWADRVSRKWLLVIGDVTTGAAQAATAALFLSGHASVWSIAVLQVLFGTANAFTRPATIGLLPQAVKATHLQQANALRSLGSNTMQIAGPAIGAVIVVAANPGWALVADAATFFVSAALRAQLRIAQADRPARKHFLADLHEGWREFRARTWVWAMVSSFGLFQLTLFPTMLVLGPVVAKQHLGGAGAWGAILACQAAGAVLGGLVSLRIRFKRPLLASALVMLPTALMLAALGLAAPLWVLCATSLLATTCLLCGDIVWQSTFQTHVPEHLISRLSSFDWLGSVALNPIGYALVGPLAARIGVPETLYLAAAVNACVSLVLASVPAIRAFPAGSAGGLEQALPDGP